jgi:hypothetical protein
MKELHNLNSSFLVYVLLKEGAKNTMDIEYMMYPGGFIKRALQAGDK